MMSTATADGEGQDKLLFALWSRKSMAALEYWLTALV